MATGVTLSCSCGEHSARLLSVTPQHGFHASCDCDDCHATNDHHGVHRRKGQPIDLYQTSPSNLKILSGIENLSVLQLYKSSRLLRWYAKCCGTPMYNTMKSPKLPVVGIVASNIDTPEALGPVRAQGFVKKCGKTTHKNMVGLLSRMIGRMARERISGRWRNTPFFDVSTMKPVMTLYTLTRHERTAAYKPR
jgi:hypothetical protein